MDTFIGFGVGVLRLVPVIIAFYVPALTGVALIKERGESYKIKAALIFAMGFGGIVAVHLLLRSSSALQAAEIVALSLLQIAAALFFAALTVYKLAD